MSTTDTDATDELDPDEETVLVKSSGWKKTYHKLSADGVTPPCRCNGADDESRWSEWPTDRAAAWTEPCQLPNCYGADP